MDLSNFSVFLGISAATFLFTLAFSFSYTFLQRFKETSTYAKCLAGGIILATLLFHVFPDVCTSENFLIGEFATGISFLLLFAIDKLYLYTGNNENDTLPENITKAQAIVFIIALSLHSFLEGLGIPAKSGSKLIYYIIGLFGHKWIEAFALSVSVHTSGFSKKYIKFLLMLYSSLTPLGTIVGYLMIQFMSNTEWFLPFECCLNGIACGSFIYIVFMEMLLSEFNNIKKRKNKFFTVVMGFLIMSFASFVVHHLESRN